MSYTIKNYTQKTIDTVKIAALTGLAALVISASGCANTLHGLAKDIEYDAGKVAKWTQNAVDKQKAKKMAQLREEEMNNTNQHYNEPVNKEY